jgi:DNA-binding CsgD family transcriptional regulator
MDGRGRPRHPETLTPRQQEVLELVRDGMTNREIAERLGISYDAAKYHVSEIISRTGSTTRHEAARWLEEQCQRATASQGEWRRTRPGVIGRRRSRVRGACVRRGDGRGRCGPGVRVILSRREAA